MSIFKFKSQKFGMLEETHTDLFEMINIACPDCTDEQKGRVAGLCIEYVIKSNGDVDIFQEDIDVDQDELDADFEEVDIH